MTESWLNSFAFKFLLLFAFTIPWENIVMIEGVGTIGRMVGVCALLVGIASIFNRQGLNLKTPSTFLFFFVLFVAWSASSYYWSIDPNETVRRLFTLLQLLAMIWLIEQLCVTPKRRNLLLQAYVLGGFLSIMSTIFMYNSITPEDYQRYTALGFDANDLGTTIALGVPLSWHLARTSKHQLVYLINLLYIPAAFVAIIFTSSRSSLLVALVGTILIPLTLHQMGRRKRIGLAIALVCGIGSLFYLSQDFMTQLTPNLERLSTISEEILRGDLNGRTVIWRAGLEAFAAHPIIGTGLNSFPWAVEPYLGKSIVSHNSFLSVLVDTGVIGFTLFFLAFLSIFVSLCRLERATRNFTVLLLIVLTIAMFPLSWEYRKPVWFILSLLTTYTTYTFVSIKSSASRQLNLEFRK